MWQKVKNIYHLITAVLVNLCFGLPSRKLIVMGITGTDGKTTTVSLIYHILRTCGRKASMISSLGTVIDGKTSPLPFHVTTPSPFKLTKYIKKAMEIGSKYLVLEVTSHALDQYRTLGVNFEVGVLTNVTHEHLDYHKTYENYAKTKIKLIKLAKKAVVNMDDDSYKIVKSELPDKKLTTYGMSNNSDVNPQNFSLPAKFLGDFNKYNLLAAVAVARVLGLSDNQIKRGIQSFVMPIGRQDVVYNKNFTVMVDFAHTPNAFEKILGTVKPKVKGKLIHVFGSAGERDVDKRPKMGKISARFSDVIILTSEDPRIEGVDKINKEIVSGIQNSKLRIQNGMLIKIPDRQEAINKAIIMAKKGDFVLITGKAHEKSMNYGHGEEPWDEYEAVKKALSLRFHRAPS